MKKSAASLITAEVGLGWDIEQTVTNVTRILELLSASLGLHILLLAYHPGEQPN